MRLNFQEKKIEVGFGGYLKVSKFLRQFFLKLHCPKNERNIRQNSALGLDQFLATAKGASNKRSSDEHNKRDRGGESSSKRRKDY